MRVLVIGAGGAGNIHAEELAEVRGHEVAVFDHDGDRARALATSGQKFGANIVVCEDPMEDGYDLAVVAVPANAHREVAEAQAALRPAVVVEKPLALYPEDAAALAALPNLYIAESQCYAGEDGLGVARMAHDIEGDALGWPVIWRICAQTAWRPQAWCNDLAVGGGAFLEGGVHMLTTARVLFGEASGWQGSVRHFSGGTAPDSGTIMVDYEGGHQCVLSLYWGTEGCFDGTCATVSAPATLVTPRLTRAWWPADDHHAMWGHLLKCIAGEAEPVATLAHAAGAVADVWRCYEAAGVTR